MQSLAAVAVLPAIGVLKSFRNSFKTFQILPVLNLAKGTLNTVCSMGLLQTISRIKGLSSLWNPQGWLPLKTH